MELLFLIHAHHRKGTCLDALLLKLDFNEHGGPVFKDRVTITPPAPAH
jgi:hypothetical protein